MAIPGKKTLNIGIENQSLNSDSLYTAFHKIEDNFGTLFNSASSLNTFLGQNGIGVTASSSNGTVIITNTGVTKLTSGTGISLSGSNGNITISVSGNVKGNLVAGVTNVGIFSNTLAVSNSPIVSSGIINVDLPKISSLTSGTYTTPNLTVDETGRITSITNGVISGAVTSVIVANGKGIAVTGSPITSSGTITVTNTGVTRLRAGTGITLTDTTGDITISASAINGGGNGTVTRVDMSSSTLDIVGSPITTSGRISIELPSNISIGNLVVTGNSNLGNANTINIGGGTNGYILQTDGFGNLSWTQPSSGTSSATAAGSNTQVQFNDSGSFNGSSSFTFNKSSNTLSVGNIAANGAGLYSITGSNITGNLTSLTVTTTGQIGGKLKVIGDTELSIAKATTPTYPSNDTSIATTAYVKTAIEKTAPDITVKANITSPDFKGIPTAPTAGSTVNSNQIATTEFVKTAILGVADISNKANINSPNLTGTPTAPNAISSANSNQIATTAFVKLVLPDVTLKANIDSPNLTGTPTAPNAVSTANSNQIATTAFVKTAINTVPVGLGDPGGNGIVVRTGGSTANRIVSAGTGIGVTNGDGVLGNIQISNKGVLSFNGANGNVTARLLGQAGTVTASNTTTMKINNISNTVVQITVVYTNVKGTSASNLKTNAPKLQVGTGTGSVITTVGYTGAVVSTTGTVSGTSSFTDGFITTCSNVSNASIHQGQITLTKLYTSSDVWIVSGTSSFTNATSHSIGTLSGTIDLGSRELSSVQLTTVGEADKFTSGTFNVYVQ